MSPNYFYYMHINLSRYTAAHTLDLYCEVAAICRPPLRDVSAVKRSHTPTTGYIISVYKVEKFLS